MAPSSPLVVKMVGMERRQLSWQRGVQRGVSFEAVVVAIESGDLPDIVEHPNQARYQGQRILVVLISGYAHLVPCVEADDHLFLKTIIPSRKATIAYRPGDAP